MFSDELKYLFFVIKSGFIFYLKFYYRKLEVDLIFFLNFSVIRTKIWSDAVKTRTNPVWASRSPSVWSGAASCQALKCPSVLLETSVVVRLSAVWLKHTAVIRASWGAEMVVFSTKLLSHTDGGQNRREKPDRRGSKRTNFYKPQLRRSYLWVCSSKRHSFRFSSRSAASCFLSSTVASQDPEASNAARTTSNCSRPDSWMYSCCTTSSCPRKKQTGFRSNLHKRSVVRNETFWRKNADFKAPSRSLHVNDFFKITLKRHQGCVSGLETGTLQSFKLLSFGDKLCLEIL